MTDCLRLGSLSGSSLKVIAIVSMTIDHLGLYMLGGEDAAGASATYHLMRMAGRLAFPIFAFLLVEGYVHTRDIRKYMLNLFVAAVISDIPWMLLGGYDSHNVMFTLLLGLMAVSFIDRFWRNRFLTLAVIGGIAILAEWLQTDYSWRGIFLICVLFMFRQKPLLAFMFGLGIWPCWLCRWADDADAVFRPARFCYWMVRKVFLLCLLSAAPDAHLADAIVSWLSDVP